MTQEQIKALEQVVGYLQEMGEETEYDIWLEDVTSIASENRHIWESAMIIQQMLEQAKKEQK